jgi:hypothetical protein
MPALFVAAALSAAVASCSTDTDALRAMDQALLDATAPGDPAVWDKTLTSDAVYVDENGAIMTRADLMKRLVPLPANISGQIEITDFAARFDGDTALVIRTDDESEIWHGIPMRATYITTETWLCRANQWQLAMIHAYVEAKDPPAIALPSAELDEYVGRYTAADLSLTIRRDGAQLVQQRADAKSAHTLFVELRDVLFIPSQPRIKQLFQRDASGHITGFIDRREGEDVVWQKDE